MQRSTGAKVIATSHSQSAPNQRYTSPFPAWMRAATRKLSVAFGQQKNAPQGLPQYNVQTKPTTCPPTGSNPSSQQSLLLMTCMQRGPHDHAVHQDSIEGITTDKDLFHFMRRQLSKRRGYIHKISSLKCIQGLYFIKVPLLHVIQPPSLTQDIVPTLVQRRRRSPRSRTMLHTVSHSNL